MIDCRSLRRVRVAAVVVVAGAVLGGCASDSTEIVTFTDAHGRVCTATVVVDSEDGDQEVSALDCDYPPAGTSPGPSAYHKMPVRP